MKNKRKEVFTRNQDLDAGAVIYADSMFYCYAEKEGALALVKAGPESFEIISKFSVPLGSRSHWAHPVIYKGVLYVRHGEAMRKLIRTNPDQAIQESLSISEWSELAPEIQKYVEQPFSALANVDVMIACGDEGSRSSVVTTFLEFAQAESLSVKCAADPL